MSKEDKIKIGVEIVIVLAAFIYYIIFIGIPDLKSSYGSSDHFIKESDYLNMYEFNIDDSVNFSIVINKENKISHIFFFNKSSLCLYNHNIEGMSIKKGLTSIVTLLIENNYLKNTSLITITNYGNDESNFIGLFKSSLSKYSLNNSINLLDDEIDNLISRISVENGNELVVKLRNIDLYSKELIRNKNNNVSKNNSNYGSNNSNLSDLVLDKDSAHKYTNNVYKRIDNYVYKNNISELNIGEGELIISDVPADNDLLYYPTSSSYYYVKDKKVYAYIEINDGVNFYGYCYGGSIDLSHEGMC